jgi:hypothetical protein
MSGIKKIWSDTYKVHSFQVDMKHRATTPALCRYMQESAWNHAENLKLGYSYLSKKDMAVLCEQLVRIQRFPHRGDTIHVHTLYERGLLSGQNRSFPR